MTPEQEALIEWLHRKERIVHPVGSMDKGCRWYPSDNEKQSCCSHIRPPSRTYPWSLMVHCRTLEHVANLYRVQKEKVQELMHKKNLPLLLGLDEHLDRFIERKLKKTFPSDGGVHADN